MAILDEKTKKQIFAFQKSEITEFEIYRRLAAKVKDQKNRDVLESIAADEKQHYDFWKTHSGRDITPDFFKIFKYVWISRLLGLTFGIKLMENGEGSAQSAYRNISSILPEAEKIALDEDRHERELIGLIDEESLQYIGSVVLGLNDALVELTGALAGFTLALQQPKLVATAGFITGIAASFSMAASEYLSTKSEGGHKSPWKASIYTGIAYILTVFILIAPFLLLSNLFLSLAITIGNAILIIFLFTFYMSVAKDLDFKRRFAEMALISLGVAALSFLIGFIVRAYLNIDV